MPQPTFNEKLLQIQESMHNLSQGPQGEDTKHAAMATIAPLCWLLASAYPQDVQNRVNKIVGDLNKIANV